MPIMDLKFNAARMKKLMKDNPSLNNYYQWQKWGGVSDTKALRKVFEEFVLTTDKWWKKYDAGEIRKKLGRPPILGIPFIPHREYSKNWKTVDEIAGKLGCNLTAWDPDWLIHYGHHSMDISYEVMRQLALLLDYKWIDKKKKAR